MSILFNPSIPRTGVSEGGGVVYWYKNMNKTGGKKTKYIPTEHNIFSTTDIYDQVESVNPAVAYTVVQTAGYAIMALLIMRKPSPL